MLGIPKHGDVVAQDRQLEPPGPGPTRGGTGEGLLSEERAEPERSAVSAWGHEGDQTKDVCGWASNSQMRSGVRGTVRPQWVFLLLTHSLRSREMGHKDSGRSRQLFGKSELTANENTCI